MRINKFLAQCGVASRRKCEEYILNGDITINGEVITNLSTTIDPDSDQIFYRGKPLQLPDNFSYYILNKPKNYLVTTEDTFGREIVFSLLNGINEKLFYIGRLDYESEGALLFTNDGNLSHRLLHPKYTIPKQYYVEVNGFINDDQIKQLESGIILEEGKTNPTELFSIYRTKKKSTFKLILTQGWNRQIRRMISAIDSTVTYLRRDSFANITIDHLPIGEYRPLTQHEIYTLKQLVQLD